MRMGKRWCSWGGLSHCLEEEGGCTQLLHLKGGAKNGITSKWDLGVKHPRRKDCPSGSGCVSSAKFTVTHAEGVASKLSALWPALLLQFETFWLPSLSTSPRLYHFYLLHAVLFIPHLSNRSTPPSPAFCFTKPPALLSTPQHLPSPLSTFSSSPSQKYLLYFQECQPWGDGKDSTHRGGCAPPSNSICIRHLSLEMAASGSPRRTFQQD